MSLDGGDLRAVTRDGSIALAPSWSPDGRSLLFTSFASGNPSLFASDLGGEKRLISSRRGLNLGGRWSPGGKAIAVALESGGATDIALIDSNGQVMHFVTKDRGIDVYWFTWNDPPDGWPSAPYRRPQIPAMLMSPCPVPLQKIKKLLSGAKIALPALCSPAVSWVFTRNSGPTGTPDAL